MKATNIIIKIVAALAAVAGVVYVIATYGDKIVAWAKKMLGKCECDCEECECEGCEECCSECEGCEQTEETEEAEEEAEEVVVEETAVVAEEKDFENQ